MKNWYAIYTKPKAEDSTAQMLEKAGIEILNPKIKIKKYLRKKYGETVEQLFPCYLFAHFDLTTHSHMIRYTRGVKYIVGKESPLVVHSEIIEAIKERMRDGFILPEPNSYEKGDKVLIKEGPFKDFYGVFERSISGKDRAMILLEALYCKIEIETSSIKSADKPR